MTLTPAWLAGRTVKEFRISREGARALVISEQNGKTRVQVTGIIRTADGTPRDLTAPMTLLTAPQPGPGGLGRRHHGCRHEGLRQRAP